MYRLLPVDVCLSDSRDPLRISLSPFLYVNQLYVSLIPRHRVYMQVNYKLLPLKVSKPGTVPDDGLNCMFRSDMSAKHVSCKTPVMLTSIRTGTMKMKMKMKKVTTTIPRTRTMKNRNRWNRSRADLFLLLDRTEKFFGPISERFIVSQRKPRR